MHHTQDAADIAFARKDGEEDFAGRAGILEGAVDQAEAPAHEVAQGGGQLEPPQLRVLEETHESLRVLAENGR